MPSSGEQVDAVRGGVPGPRSVPVDEIADRLGLTGDGLRDGLDLVATGNDRDTHDGWPGIRIPFGELLPPAVLQTGSAGGLSVRLVERREMPPNALLSERVGTPGQRVVLIEQLGSYEGEPLYLLTGYYATDRTDVLISTWDATHGGDRNHGLPESFAEVFGTPHGHTATSVQAVRCDDRTAEHLRVPVGATALLRELRMTDRDGIARVLVHVHYRADRVAMNAMLGDDRG